LDTEQILQMVKSIVQNTDSNYSGEIDYTEYLVAAINKDKLLTRDKLQKAFQSFDLNGDGYISKEEWEKCFGNTKLSQQDWVTFLEEVDSNKDGNISIDEFFNFLEKTCIR
jgi:calcium-dependent protein kinase